MTTSSSHLKLEGNDFSLGFKVVVRIICDLWTSPHKYKNENTYYCAFSVHVGTTWLSSCLIWSTCCELCCVLCALRCGPEGLVSHGCISSSDAFSRSAGDFLSMQPIRHLACGESHSGIEKAPWRILANKAAGCVSWNGYRPTSMVYRDTPRLQMSAARPEYEPFPLVSSSGLT